MPTRSVFKFLHRQIPVMIILSVFPGLGYLVLSWFQNLHIPAVIWYICILFMSFMGFILYKKFNFDEMSRDKLENFYILLRLYYYVYFLLWTVIFIVYCREVESNLHYISIFTQIGASVVASTLLYPDRKLYIPTILIFMIPLGIYFFLIGEWYSYVLTIFTGVFAWVLLYAAGSSNNLLKTTEFQASHDTLTGLYNRNYFIENIQIIMNTLNEIKRYSYLILIDLDHFKTINDSLGHDIGDQLLEEVAERLNKIIPSGNLVARLGGDEFIITGGLIQNSEQAEKESRMIAGQILSNLKETYIIGEHHLFISASIGVCIIQPGDKNANRLIKEADIAMYEVKESGRDGVFLFNNEMSTRVEHHLEIERLLHFAVQENKITLEFQPQYDDRNRIIGAESLARWHDAKLGIISPSQFIPIAEQTGLIIDLGSFILKTSFKTLKEWIDKGIRIKQFSVNISMRQLLHQNFVNEVFSLLKDLELTEIDTVILFEITESILAEDFNHTVRTMKELHKAGIRFSMDDFGTGYSSLSYLKKLPISELKIDRSFIQDLGLTKGDNDMISTMLNISEIFGLSVMAEGIETEEQYQILKKLKCENFQGFYFSYPLTQSGFEELFLKSNMQ